MAACALLCVHTISHQTVITVIKFSKYTSAICWHPSKLPAPLSPPHKYFSRSAPGLERQRRSCIHLGKTFTTSRTANAVQRELNSHLKSPHGPWFADRLVVIFFPRWRPIFLINFLYTYKVLNASVYLIMLPWERGAILSFVSGIEMDLFLLYPCPDD